MPKFNCKTAEIGTAWRPACSRSAGLSNEKRDDGSPRRPARSGRVAAYFTSCVTMAAFGLPQPVTRSNAVPAE